MTNKEEIEFEDDTEPLTEKRLQKVLDQMIQEYRDWDEEGSKYGVNALQAVRNTFLGELLENPDGPTIKDKKDW